MLFTTKEHPIASISVLSRNSAIEGIPLFDMGFSFFLDFGILSKIFLFYCVNKCVEVTQNENAEHLLST